MTMPHQVGLNLVPISVQQLLVLERPKNPIYIKTNGVYKAIFEEQAVIKPVEIEQYYKKNQTQFYATEVDFAQIKTLMFQRLQDHTRKLSVGDALESGTNYLNTLLQNLSLLYEDYHNQNLLSLIYQTVPSFTIYLQSNKKLISELYQSVNNERAHYLFKQPILSSLFLTAFITQYNIFSAREVQDLFLISLLKDLGMCFLPRDAWDKRELDSYQQEALNKHALNSVQLLKDRIPIHHSGLHIIEHHHFHNDTVRKYLIDQKIEQDPTLVHGIETTITAMSDLVCAMSSPRPYREVYSSEVIKKITHLILKENYSEEDKLLSKFIDHFFDLS